jgi:hypothetical protein
MPRYKPQSRESALLGFFSSRPNWDPPPHPQASVPLLWLRGGGHSLLGEGGVPIRTGFTTNMFEVILILITSRMHSISQLIT